MIYQNSIVHFFSLFIPNRDLRHSFRNKFKRKTGYRKLKDSYLIIKSDVARVEQKVNELTRYQSYIEKVLFYSSKKDLILLSISRGNALWEFIDNKKHIEEVYQTPTHSHEIFFYKRFSWISDANFDNNTDLYINHGAWVYHPALIRKRIVMLSNSLEFNIPVVFEEDGFIHSINGTPMRKNRVEFKTGFSMIVDAVSNHIDATSITSIESELNSDCSYSKAEIQRAKKLISEIVKNKISKYNGQPLDSDLDIDFNKYKTVVLVIDQAYNDASILKGYANANTFTKMLDAAIDENHDALILVKVHPDMIYNPNRGGLGNDINKRYGHYTDYEIKNADRERVKIIASYANPYTILEKVHKVYVCSSLMGFEALMVGKEVHIWGSPFYAGWGTGIQRTNSPAIERRNRKRSIEEIFVCAYLNFSRYIDPFSYERCELEDLIKSMAELRERYFVYKSHANSNFADFSEPVLGEEIPVAFATDAESLLNTKIAILTLLGTDKTNKYFIYCISPQSIPDKKKDDISNMAKSYDSFAGIEFIESGLELESDLKDNQNVTGTDCIKLNLHNLLKNRKRVIYSNSNVVFLRGPSHAWKSSSAFDPFIAAPPDLDENRPGLARNSERSRVWSKYFRNSMGRYVNGSFMVLNLQKIRNEIQRDTWGSYLRNSDCLNSTDILNLVCRPKIYYLSCRYAVNMDFLSDSSRYMGLFDNLFASEEYSLATDKTVAVQYPSDSPPWQKQPAEQDRLWLELTRNNPAINKILNENV